MQDTTLPDYYNMSHFLATQGGYNTIEQENWPPFEFELRYYMTVKDIKEKNEQIRQQRERQ